MSFSTAEEVILPEPSRMEEEDQKTNEQESEVQSYKIQQNKLI